MEKLDYPWYIHMGDDICVWTHYILGTFSPGSFGKIFILDILTRIQRRRRRKWTSSLTCANVYSLKYEEWKRRLVLFFQILCIQIKCFHEIINIGYVVYRSHDLPWFRTLSWYFMICSNYFFYGESIIQYFGVLLSRTVSTLKWFQIEE